MMMSNPFWIIPDWPAPSQVKTLISGRQGGVSTGVYTSLNMGLHVGDVVSAVQENRMILQAQAATMNVSGEAPAILWTEQVHGIQVVEALMPLIEPPVADAAFTDKTGLACVVMTADCLPVFFCDEKGSKVAVAHAGWRGLLDGILEETIGAMQIPASRLMAYLGPAIGPAAFEVGDEVRLAFVERDSKAADAFRATREGKWLADIYYLAKLRLLTQGVERIYGGDYCTVTEKERFFSYRRDGVTGRMASMIWLDDL